jgi:hypothetical protein
LFCSGLLRSWASLHRRVLMDPLNAQRHCDVPVPGLVQEYNGRPGGKSWMCCQQAGPWKHGPSIACGRMNGIAAALAV